VGARPAVQFVLFGVFALGVQIDASAAAKAGAKKADSTADAKAGEKKAQLCLLCHKPGNVMAAVPLLEEQPARYLYEQIKAYKEKRRPDPTMQTNVANLSDRDMRDIAQYLSMQPARREAHKVDAQKATAGKAKAAETNCAACHSKKGKDQDVPRIAGLPPAYFVSQLEAFGSGQRVHGSGATAAQPLKLSPEDAESLAHYYAEAE
jgi:cytochrome c553